MSNNQMQSNIVLGSGSTDRSVLKKEWKIIKQLNWDTSLVRNTPKDSDKKQKSNICQSKINRTGSLISQGSQEPIACVVKNNGIDESPKVNTSYEISADKVNKSPDTTVFVEKNGMDEFSKLNTSYEISADKIDESPETVGRAVQNEGMDESPKVNTSNEISPDSVDELQYISDGISNNCIIVDENCDESQECFTTCKNGTGTVLNDTPQTVVTEVESRNISDKNLDDKETVEPFVSRGHSVDGKRMTVNDSENTVDGDIRNEFSTPKCEHLQRMCKTDVAKKNFGSLFVRRSARIQSKLNKSANPSY